MPHFHCKKGTSSIEAYSSRTAPSAPRAEEKRRTPLYFSYIGPVYIRPAMSSSNVYIRLNEPRVHLVRHLLLVDRERLRLAAPLAVSRAEVAAALGVAAVLVLDHGRDDELPLELGGRALDAVGGGERQVRILLCAVLCLHGLEERAVDHERRPDELLEACSQVKGRGSAGERARVG